MVVVQGDYLLKGLALPDFLQITLPEDAMILT
jgi:hypothetical protein